MPDSFLTLKCAAHGLGQQKAETIDRLDIEESVLDALEDAFRKLTRLDAPTLIEKNRAIHRVTAFRLNIAGRISSVGGAQVQVIDFDTPRNNDWLAVNQFTVPNGQHTRRPDIFLFLSG